MTSHHGTVEAFVARTPVFDDRQRVFGYELLAPRSIDQVVDRRDTEQTVLQVIGNSFFLFGAEVVTGGRKAFLRFSRDMITGSLGLLFPNDLVVVELFGDVEPEPEVIEACKDLKGNGYQIAIDAFDRAGRVNGLIGLADLVRVDLTRRSIDTGPLLVERLKPRRFELIAENVEDHETFERANDAGYQYFQGSFFSKPVIIAGRDVPANTRSYLNLLREINQPDLDFGSIEQIIKNEVALTYKLLRCINSVAFGLRHQVRSIRQAMMLLGERGVRKWASLVVMSSINQRGLSELIVGSLLRAKFCELLAEPLHQKDREEDLFLVGLFSMLDAITNRPLEEVIEGLPLSSDVRAALLARIGMMGRVLEMVLAYERADWTHVSALASELGVPSTEVVDSYLEATAWSNAAAEL
ncbi:MAG: HDOD domain-containing protein [Chloroflexota bacterium]